MPNSNRSYRSSQLISPFGPGSIIDIGDESLILMDIKHWPKNLEEIKLDRLTREAGVWALKKPPVLKNRWDQSNKHNALITARFPTWMFCPKCRHLKRWQNTDVLNDNGTPICQNKACNNKSLVPMRFVAACNKGHLQDIPWDYWAHHYAKTSCSDKKTELYFTTRKDMGSGLGALEVHCKNCGAKNSLASIMNDGALNIKCSNKQPWEFSASLTSNCDETLHVLQRGSSNLYYPIIRSALDIPYKAISAGNTIIEAIQDTEDYSDLLRAIERGNDRRAKNCAEDLAEAFGFPIEAIMKAVETGGEPPREFRIPKDEDLRIAEWEVLSSVDIESKISANFHARIAPFSKAETFGCESLIKKVVLLDKLREVRAFCGFERLKPDENTVLMQVDSNQKPWLPACEVFGEGIFIEFDQVVIDEWEVEAGEFLILRLASVLSRYSNLASTYLPEPSAKFIALHTFAHLLIRQLSFESGYSSGSLRERVFAGKAQAGILIYTADGDSEGSLGGLVQQGEANRLFPAIIAALETANWCSNDPVCSELDTQGVMGLNKAACHSCSLISETSCEHNNLLLDRKLVIGDINDKGLFSDIMKKVCEGFS